MAQRRQLSALRSGDAEVLGCVRGKSRARFDAQMNHTRAAKQIALRAPGIAQRAETQPRFSPGVAKLTTV